MKSIFTDKAVAPTTVKVKSALGVTYELEALVNYARKLNQQSNRGMEFFR